MMECKKALVETNGDLDTAAENMRKSGLAKADKKASRVAAEGVVVIEKSADGKTGVLVEVNSETDFVARGDDFRGFAREVAKAALAAGASSVEAVNWPQARSGETVDEKRRALIAKIGENLNVRRVALVTAPTVVGSYVHTDNKKAALVAVEGGDADTGARPGHAGGRGQPALPDAGGCAGRAGGQGARNRPNRPRASSPKASRPRSSPR